MFPEWRKSSRSGAGNDCVQVNAGIKVGSTRVGGAVRDSKNPNVTLAVSLPVLIRWIRNR
jgi:Domain of unknown function (DUF397)